MFTLPDTVRLGRARAARRADYIHRPKSRVLLGIFLAEMKDGTSLGGVCLTRLAIRLGRSLRLSM